MAVAAALRPVGHSDELTIVGHLDELRSRLIVMVVAFAATFAVCFAFNGTLLHLAGEPLAKTTQQRTLKGKGPLGEIYVAQRGARQLAAQNVAVFTALAADRTVSPATHAVAATQLLAARHTLATLPRGAPPNKPITLGVGEPFVTTLTVALYFALLFSLPILLWQLFGFVLPALAPEQHRLAKGLVSLVPALFAAGVVFGYFLVLPAATSFLQNFNSGSFNVLVQAKDYYKFTAMLLLAMGMVFQLPVAILALTRLGIVNVTILRQNRRYAILVLTVIAAALPGVDPVSMLVELVPLLALYEVSILLARMFGGPERSIAGDLLDRWREGADDAS